MKKNCLLRHILRELEKKWAPCPGPGEMVATGYINSTTSKFHTMDDRTKTGKNEKMFHKSALEMWVKTRLAPEAHFDCDAWNKNMD
ncbi:hypothetical protein Pla52n_62020 [Stieleria varia]|uniref:Uncharacterized protein n=1 Tax=Stieleria varia TaxID=2528005 RepID=A0A5C6A0J6_9BACT|nr:hypothetical protein Pla52n_62020 [Stieleria varia]